MFAFIILYIHVHYTKMTSSCLINPFTEDYTLSLLSFTERTPCHVDIFLYLRFWHMFLCFLSFICVLRLYYVYLLSFTLCYCLITLYLLSYSLDHGLFTLYLLSFILVLGLFTLYILSFILCFCLFTLYLFS